MAAKKKKLKSKVKLQAKKSVKVPAKSKAKVQAKTKATVQAKAKITAKAQPQRPTPLLKDIGAFFTPLDDRLIVNPEQAPTQTAGGIFIPTTVEGKPSRGQVLAKGRGRRNKKGTVRPLDVSVGDHVMFAEFSGTKITMAGREVLILREEDVLGIVI